MLAYILEQKLTDRKLAFWLPFRASQKRTNVYIKELKIDFGNQVFNKEQLETELASRFNNIQLKKVSDEEDLGMPETLQGIHGGSFLDNYNDNSIFDPVKMMESNLINVTNLSVIQPFNLQDETYGDFYNDLNFLSSTRSKKSALKIEEIKEEKNGMDFTPLLKKHSRDSRGLRHLDTSSFIVTEDEYKAIKIENNLDNLNKDIEQVNVEIE